MFDLNDKVNDTINDMKGIFNTSDNKDVQRAMKPIKNGVNFAGKTVTKASKHVQKKLYEVIKKGLKNCKEGLKR